MRLNVYLQKAGIGSRREAERLIAAGRVTVNGQLATATTPVPANGDVKVDGAAVAPQTRPLPRLFRLYKPLDVLVTSTDPQGRATIYDLPALSGPAAKQLPRLVPVGRLDVNSEGLLLLTNEGPLAQALMSPHTGLERTYRVRVRGKLTDKQLAIAAKGARVQGVQYRGARIELEKQPTGANTWYQVVLTEGKNREIRKLMDHFGCVVNRLIRLQYGPLRVDGLQRGQLVEVPPKQVQSLLDLLRTRGVDITEKIQS